MLGHANVSETSTYLNAGRLGLQESMQRFDPARCKPVVKPAIVEPPTDHNEAEAKAEPSHSKLSASVLVRARSSADRAPAS